jgi:prepilin-type N-terminal cleavage/methylation domain-containing protein
MLSGKARLRHVGGFTLVELMVAMAAGLVLLGAVLALLASSARANAITIQSTKLSQELRALSGIVVGEVRRARYNPAALSNIGLGNAALNPYDEVRIEGGGSCLRFSYARADGQHARTFAYRDDANGIGTLFFATGADPANPPACGAAAVRLSSPQVDITDASFVTPEDDLVTVEFEARLAGGANPPVTRSVRDSVRIASRPLTP